MKISTLFFAIFISFSLVTLTGFKKLGHKHSKIKKTLMNDIVIPEKSLDLSVPFSLEKFSNSKTDSAADTKSNFTIEKQKKKEPPILLDTHTISFPYPETDKTQSVDGAGININLKR